MSEWSNTGSWAYWHGAPWRQRGAKPNGKAKGDPSNKEKDQQPPLFPAYDNKKGGADLGQGKGNADLVRVVSTTRTEDTLVKELQRALNHTRKIESKVAKIQGDVQEKKQQWVQWERQLKQCYIAEKKRHSSNLESLGKELAETLQLQEAARAEVRRIAAGQSSAPMEEDAIEGEDQFAALMADEEPSPWGEDVNEEVLMRALQTATQGPPTTPPSGRPCPRTPYSRQAAAKVAPQPNVAQTSGMGSRLQPFPPPRPAATQAYPAADLNPLPSPTAHADPYQVVIQSGDSGASTAPVKMNRPKPKLGARVPLKEQAKPSGPMGKRVITHSPSKVEEMRAAAMKQLFGGNCTGDPGGAQTSMPASTAVAHPGAQHFSIQDDDGPEQDGTASAGLEGIMD